MKAGMKAFECHTKKFCSWAPLQARPRARSQRAPTCAASAPKNLVGVHSGVFVGGWSSSECEQALSSAKNAGYDLIEGAALNLVGFYVTTKLRQWSHFLYGYALLPMCHQARLPVSRTLLLRID